MFLVSVTQIADNPQAKSMVAEPAILHELDKLTLEYADVFADTLPPGLPPDRHIPPVIQEKPDSQPIPIPMYRLSQLEKAEVDRQVKALLAAGKIEPSSSPYGAPVLFVSKKDGGLRMVIDYRRLNKQTVANRYPSPRIDDLFDRLANAKVFSALDLTSGYHQIPMAAEERPKTAFRTPLGHFQWNVLSFGLTNAPSTFQAVMNEAFKDVLQKLVLIYIDDVLVFSDTEEEHLGHLHEVFNICRSHKFYLRKGKCHFFKENLAFLGQIVGRNGMQIDPKRIEQIQKWPAHSSMSELRSFLGLLNYFRKYIQGYANLTADMYQLLKKDVPYVWTAKCQHSFESAKYAMTHAPVLALPDFSKPFEVMTDASGVGIGAILLQEGTPYCFLR